MSSDQAKAPARERTAPTRNYPAEWGDIRGRVLERHMHRCVNCRRARGGLEVHHIVPVGQAGSHRASNLVPLCSRCHRAVHGEGMAPRVRWYTNGELTPEEFRQHKLLWKRLREEFGVPRYDPESRCVYVPLADVEMIVERMPQ